MNRIENRLDRAVDALIYAYLHDTLQMSSSCRCVIGNIVSVGYGHRIEKLESGGYNSPVHSGHWADLFCNGRLSVDRPNVHPKAKENIEVTGYSVEQMRHLEGIVMERAAMLARYNTSSVIEINADDYYFEILNLAIETLYQIEGRTDFNEIKESLVKSELLELQFS